MSFDTVVLTTKLLDISIAMKLADSPPYEKRAVELSRGEFNALIDALHLVEAVRMAVKA